MRECAPSACHQSSHLQLSVPCTLKLPCFVYVSQYACIDASDLHLPVRISYTQTISYKIHFQTASVVTLTLFIAQVLELIMCSCTVVEEMGFLILLFQK